MDVWQAVIAGARGIKQSICGRQGQAYSVRQGISDQLPGGVAQVVALIEAGDLVL